MARINVDSQYAETDKSYLRQCYNSLCNAKSLLSGLKFSFDDEWVGNSQERCVQLFDGFIKQIDDQISRTTRAENMLDTIVESYREADTKLSGGWR